MFTDWRVVKLGSNANNSANTGTFYMNANNTASNNNVNIGSQLALNFESEHQNHASWQNK
jgi:ribosomal 50S subunit-recycling heat shock protein